MARDRYWVLVGLDYSGRRVEPGAVVDDIPKDAVSWLIECGAIAPHTTPDQGERRRIAAKPRSPGDRSDEKGQTP